MAFKYYRLLLRQAITIVLLASGQMLQAAPTGMDANGHLKVVETKSEGFSLIRLENGVQLHFGDIVKNVIFYDSTTVRVNENLGQNYWKYPSIVVVEEPVEIQFEILDAEDSVTVISAKLHIRADKKSCRQCHCGIAIVKRHLHKTALRVADDKHFLERLHHRIRDIVRKSPQRK